MNRLHESLKRTRGMIQFGGLLTLIAASAILFITGIVYGAFV